MKREETFSDKEIHGASLCAMCNSTARSNMLTDIVHCAVGAAHYVIVIQTVENFTLIDINDFSLAIKSQFDLKI